MATVPTPGTQTTGLGISSGLVNGFRDALNFLLGAGSNVRPYAHVWQSAAQTIPAATTTTVLFGAEVKDTDGLHSIVTNTGNLVIVTAGLYDLRSNLTYDTPNTGTTRSLFLQQALAATPTVFVAVGGSSTSPPSGTTLLSAAAFVQCAVGDILRVQTFSTNAGPLITGAGATMLQALWVQE